MNSCTLIRRARNTGMRGGGVAIWCNNEKIAISRARQPHSKPEEVAAIGRRAGRGEKYWSSALMLCQGIQLRKIRI